MSLLDTQPVNHLIYADNSVILAPTPQALQKLLHIYVNHMQMMLMYNTKKTFCMAVLVQMAQVLY